jgi:hypothetical protein
MRKNPNATDHSRYKCRSNIHFNRQILKLYTRSLDSNKEEGQ